MDELVEFQFGTYKGVVLAFLLTAILGEFIFSQRFEWKNYNIKDSGANVIILIGLRLSKFLLASYQLWVLDHLAGIAPINIPTTGVTFLVAFFVVDFLFYWYHYLSHKLKALWAFHLVHHSSQWMNLTTAYRLNWLGAIIVPLFFAPAVLIGFSPSLVAICVALNLIYQFFLHTELIPKLGWIDKVLNTPSNHRVHHGMNPEYIDKNFGGVFIFWDRLFGTYEEESVKPVYGITTGFVEFNPFKLVFHGFLDLFSGKLKSKG